MALVLRREGTLFLGVGLIDNKNELSPKNFYPAHFLPESAELTEGVKFSLRHSVGFAPLHEKCIKPTNLLPRARVHP